MIRCSSRGKTTLYRTVRRIVLLVSIFDILCLTVYYVTILSSLRNKHSFCIKIYNYFAVIMVSSTRVYSNQYQVQYKLSTRFTLNFSLTKNVKWKIYKCTYIKSCGYLSDLGKILLNWTFSFFKCMCKHNPQLLCQEHMQRKCNRQLHVFKMNQL